MIYFNSLIPFPLSHITILINLSPKLRAPKRPVWYKNPSGTTIPTDGLVSKRSVHKVAYVTLFLDNFYPLPSHTLSHIPGSPPPIFSRPSKNIPDKSPLYKFSLNCSRGFLSGGFVRGSFVWKV